METATGEARMSLWGVLGVGFVLGIGIAVGVMAAVQLYEVVVYRHWKPR